MGSRRSCRERLHKHASRRRKASHADGGCHSSGGWEEDARQEAAGSAMPAEVEMAGAMNSGALCGHLGCRRTRGCAVQPACGACASESPSAGSFGMKCCLSTARLTSPCRLSRLRGQPAARQPGQPRQWRDAAAAAQAALPLSSQRRQGGRPRGAAGHRRPLQQRSRANSGDCCRPSGQRYSPAGTWAAGCRAHTGASDTGSRARWAAGCWR